MSWFLDFDYFNTELDYICLNPEMMHYLRYRRLFGKTEVGTASITLAVL